MKVNTYNEEWKETIQSLKEQNRTYRELEYFLQLAERQGDFEDIKQLSPKVILLGHDFPDEIIRAMGEVPYYLFGGSFAAANLAENLVPRDTDSAIKSILGILTKEELQLDKNTIILLPLAGDSMRKLAGVLGESYKVIAYEVPSDKNSTLQKKRWAEEILRVTLEVEKHLRRYMTKKSLMEQCRISQDAATVWNEFSQTCNESKYAVSGTARIMIANSYHWCMDKEEWSNHLAKLTQEIKGKKQKNGHEIPHLHVMLLGSPIYMPNYKVPFLIEEMGLELYSVIHPDMAHLSERDTVTRCSRTTLIERLAEKYLQMDMSTAFIDNDAILDTAKEELRKGNIHGIVIHILKGQIEYDFELNRLEKMIKEYELPVFRLETDYNYQDVEQLRIRLEAFAEMLSHRASMHQMEVRYVKKAI